MNGGPSAWRPSLSDGANNHLVELAGAAQADAIGERGRLPIVTFSRLPFRWYSNRQVLLPHTHLRAAGRHHRSAHKPSRAASRSLNAVKQETPVESTNRASSETPSGARHGTP
jgi:hypothetical protein